MELRNACRAVVLMAATGLAASAGAGTVQTDFPGAERYADAGVTPHDRQENLQALAGFLKTLGQRYLPADRTLKIEVSDVDLAGEPWPTRRGRELRIARGGADWPRITLHYTLTGPAGTITQGDETVSDMGYQQHITDRYLSEPLSYEKRMLDRWFKERFVQGKPPPSPSPAAGKAS